MLKNNGLHWPVGVLFPWCGQDFLREGESLTNLRRYFKFFRESGEFGIEIVE